VVHGAVLHGAVVHGVVMHGAVVHGAVVHGVVVHGVGVHGAAVPGAWSVKMAAVQWMAPQLSLMLLGRPISPATEQPLLSLLCRIFFIEYRFLDREWLLDSQCLLAAGYISEP
jgi:hypothetical protein